MALNYFLCLVRLCASAFFPIPQDSGLRTSHPSKHDRQKSRERAKEGVREELARMKSLGI